MKSLSELPTAMVDTVLAQHVHSLFVHVIHSEECDYLSEDEAIKVAEKTVKEFYALSRQEQIAKADMFPAGK